VDQQEPGEAGVKMNIGRYYVGVAKSEEGRSYLYVYDTVEEDDVVQFVLPRIRIEGPHLYIRS
jgi:hypothetical protein